MPSIFKDLLRDKGLCEVIISGVPGDSASNKESVPVLKKLVWFSVLMLKTVESVHVTASELWV